jgi:hypothetical protein
MKIQGKSDKFGHVLRVNDKWVKVSEDIYNKLAKGDEVDDKYNKIASAAPEVKPKYEKKVAESGKAEFRSPDQIMRSSAIGLALSFVATSLQNDVETSLEQKENLAFELAKKVEVYING